MNHFSMISKRFAKFATAVLLFLVAAHASQAATLDQGDILIADADAHAVIRIDPVTGAQTVISSGGNFVEPLGLTVDPSGDIFVVDGGFFGTGKIIRVDPLSGAQTIVSAGGLFVRPFDLALDAAGQILVVDTGATLAFEGPGSIIRVDPMTGAQALVSSGGLLVGPTGITLDAAGQIIVSDVDFSGPGAIIRVDPVSGAQTLISTGGSFVGPVRAVVDPTGQIFVSDQSAFRTGTTIGAIFQVDPVSGAQTVIYNSSGGGPIQGPEGIALDASGQLLVAFRGHPDFDVPDGVARIDPATGVVTVISSDGSLVGPFGITVVGEIVIPVAIDIKPGSFPNSINPKSKGVIPVAILTTGTFDATTVDSTAVFFGKTGTEVAPVHSALEDVDGDGDTDMILHFNTHGTGIVCGDTSASLTGKTLDKRAIEGSDSISTVGCK